MTISFVFVGVVATAIEKYKRQKYNEYIIYYINAPVQNGNNSNNYKHDLCVLN